jgi:hypothetical protein
MDSSCSVKQHPTTLLQLLLRIPHSTLYFIRMLHHMYERLICPLHFKPLPFNPPFCTGKPNVTRRFPLAHQAYNMCYIVLLLHSSKEANPWSVVKSEGTI